MNVVFFVVLFGTIYVTTCIIYLPQPLPGHLLECYNNNTLVAQKNNLLPHNMHTLIAILRKVEDNPSLGLGMKDLSVMLLKRFRQDGIVGNAVHGFEDYRDFKLQSMLPYTVQSFPISDSLSLTERCSLHSMLSTSFDTNNRGDESSTCHDVQALSVQLETMKNKNVRIRRESLPQRKCPLASGVINTEWGNIAGGSVLAGIATVIAENSSSSGLRGMATIAGDLAEVALKQGPKAKDYTDYTIGVEGHWNSSVSPKYFFMEDNENTEFTAAEVRGDLDGLILANVIYHWLNSMPSLRLSQIFDMYYSNIGIYNASVRACNRRKLLSTVASNNNIVTEAIRATKAVYSLIPKSISETLKNQYATQAANKLLEFIPSMNNDKMCDRDGNNPNKEFNRLAIDLMIFVDTNWLYSSLIPILTALLENSEISKYASSFTLFSALNGTAIIRSSSTILDFYELNETKYASHMKGFNLSKTIDTMQSLEKQKLNVESELDIGGAPSNIALIMPYSTASIPNTDKEYYLETVKKMRREVPDTTILFLTLGSKDKLSNLTQDPTNDIVSIADGSIDNATSPIINLMNRINRVPRRLINSQCGASWSAIGSSVPHTVYLEPHGTHFYRLHPNYFYTTDEDNVATVNIEGSNKTHTRFTICSSRNPLHIDSTADQSNCTTITNGTHRIPISCGDTRYLQECNPLYLSVTANLPANSIELCSDSKHCRFPKMMKIIISYENLKCGIAPGPNTPDINPTNTPRASNDFTILII